MHKKEFDKKKTDIIDCAEKLFFSKSYELTTVNAILKEVGIAKGTFYYYFDSKEEVMDAVITRVVEENLLYAQTVLDNQELAPFEKLLTCLFSKPETPVKETMIQQLYHSNNALMKQRALQRTIELICPVYAKIIEEGNLQGVFSSSQPLADIQFLVAGIQSLSDLSNLEHSTINVDLEAALTIMYRLLRINEEKVSKKQAKEQIQKLS